MQKWFKGHSPQNRQAFLAIEAAREKQYLYSYFKSYKVPELFQSPCILKLKQNQNKPKQIEARNTFVMCSYRL